MSGEYLPLKCKSKLVYYYIGGSRGGLRRLQPPFKISKINQTNKKNRRQSSWKVRGEKELHVFSSCYVYTRWYVYQQTLFFQNPPPTLKNFWIRTCIKKLKSLSFCCQAFSPIKYAFCNLLSWFSAYFIRVRDDISKIDGYVESDSRVFTRIIQKTFQSI